MSGLGFRLSFLAVFFLFGAYLIGPSLTGLVIGESCCTPESENCSDENACPFLQMPVPPEPLPGIGLGLIVLAISLLVGELVWRRKKEEQKEELRRNRKMRVV